MSMMAMIMGLVYLINDNMSWLLDDIIHRLSYRLYYQYYRYTINTNIDSHGIYAIYIVYIYSILCFLWDVYI